MAEQGVGMGQPKVLLHVGLPKTATTALQEHVFASSPGAANLGKPKAPAGVKQAMRRIVSELPGRCDRTHLETLAEAVRRAGASRERIVISHEGITGARRVFEGESKVLQQQGFYERQRAAAERLREALAAARVDVLFTIREQRSWLLSNYADLVLREGLSTGLREWLERGLGRPDDFYANPDFTRTIGIFDELFGADRVHVLAYEGFAEAPAEVAARLAPLAGWAPDALEERLRSLPSVKTRRELEDPDNRYLAKRKRPEKRPTRSSLTIPERLEPDLEEAVDRTCAPGNAALARRFALPLASWGYAVVEALDPEEGRSA